MEDKFSEILQNLSMYLHMAHTHEYLTHEYFTPLKIKTEAPTKAHS